MDLPDSLGVLGAQLAAGGAVAVPAELFTAHDVFVAELAHICWQPWLAVDHAGRLAAAGDYFRCEAGSRSIVFTRDAAGVHALRNACLHAGYRICEEEDGSGAHLLCRYHDWEYALDGLLTDPYLRPEQTDRTRYRLPRYAIRVERGLILVDPSNCAATPPESPLAGLPALPVDLAAARVVERRHYPTGWNWKRLRAFLWSSPVLFPEGGTVVAFGPMSRLWWRAPDAVLVRIVPRFAEHSDFTVLRLSLDPAAPAPSAADPLAEALRRAGDGPALDRDFLAWYWSQMNTAG